MYNNSYEKFLGLTQILSGVSIEDEVNKVHDKMYPNTEICLNCGKVFKTKSSLTCSKECFLKIKNKRS